MTTTTTNNDIITPTNHHPHLLEFQKRAPYDGIIIIEKDCTNNEIIKIKDKEMLTVDLEYLNDDDEEEEEEEGEKGGFFVDSDLNVYTL